MKSKNLVVWFEIYVDDLKRAQQFYETVFKVKIEELRTPNNESTMKMMSFPMEMNGAGATGALVKMDGSKAGGNSTVVYFKSDDCSIEEKRIRAAGGNVLQSKQSIEEYGYMVLALDSEGNMFGIHSEK